MLFVNSSSHQDCNNIFAIKILILHILKKSIYELGSNSKGMDKKSKNNNISNVVILHISSTQTLNSQYILTHKLINLTV